MSDCFRANDNSPVGCRPCEPRWTFREALSPMDDKSIEVRKVNLGAEVSADAPPAFESVRAWRAVGHAAPFVVVVHACSTRCVAARNPAAAQTLGVAALTHRCASSPSTLLRALWWKYTERWGTLNEAERKSFIHRASRTIKPAIKTLLLGCKSANLNNHIHTNIDVSAGLCRDVFTSASEFKNILNNQEVKFSG